jgi:hypothetical protein
MTDKTQREIIDGDNLRWLEVKTSMLLYVPFFASLLMDMMKVKIGKFPGLFPPGNETAITDGRNVWIDRDFLSSLTLPEAVFLVCHEIGHAMWMHMSRGKQYLDMGFEGRQFDPWLTELFLAMEPADLISSERPVVPGATR